MNQPWTRVRVVAVGGLTDVGFSDDDRFLLVVGHQGRGVFDCKTAERVAYEPHPDGYYPDETTGTAEGVGPLAGQRVPVAGLMSGRVLPTAHGDWRASLTESGATVSDGRRSQLLPETEEIRAFGFGNQGRTFVLATPSDLTLLALSDTDG